MKANFHTHTKRCKHAIGSERDYVLAAIKNDLSVLGFSDHGPFPDKDYGSRMDFSELNDYLSEIDSLKTEFRNKLKLYKGLEIEYLRKYETYYEELKVKYGLDYLILGEHMYTDIDNQIKNIYFANSTGDYIVYAKNIEEAVSTGLFDIIAHPDLMFLSEFSWDKNCDKAVSIILSAAEKYDIPLEFNANGLRRGKSDFPDGRRYPYPHERFWNELKGSNQRVIIGSDCHIPDLVYDNECIKSLEICTDLGLNVIENIFEV